MANNAENYNGAVIMAGIRYETIEAAAQAYADRLSWLCESLTKSEAMRNKDAYGCQIWTPAN